MDHHSLEGEVQTSTTLHRAAGWKMQAQASCIVDMSRTGWKHQHKTDIQYKWRMKAPRSFWIQTGTFVVNQPDVEVQKQKRAVEIAKPQEEGIR